MIKIGDWVFIPGAGFYLAAWSAISAILLLLLRHVAFRFRTAGNKLVRRQATVDFPDDPVLEIVHLQRKPRRIARVSFRSGRQARYEIALREETAVRLSDA